MPLSFLSRALFGLLSWAVLGAAAYLLWSWYDGRALLDAYGRVYSDREPWRLVLGLVLLVWTVGGRYLVTPFLARRDRDPTRAERGDGQDVPGINGGSIYEESTGPADASTVILTHGWGLDSTIWYYARRDLSRSYRVVTWDLPGLGKSHVPNASDVSLDNMAGELAALIDRCGPRPVVLVGHSIGGMTIQTLARDFPAMFERRVAGVVLLNTTYTNPLKTMIFSGLAQALRRPLLDPMMWLTRALEPLAWLSAWQSYLSGSAHMANRIGFGRYVTHSQLEHNTLLATRNRPGPLAKGNQAMFRWDSGLALATMDVPQLVIAGDMDIVTKAEASRVIAKSSPRAELETVSGVNHMGFLERSDIYNAAIAKFCDKSFADVAA